MLSAASSWDEPDYPPFDIRAVAQAIAIMWRDELRKLDDIQAYRIRIPAIYDGPSVEARVRQILEQYDHHRTGALSLYQMKVEELIALIPGSITFRKEDVNCDGI